LNPIASIHVFFQRRTFAPISEEVWRRLSLRKKCVYYLSALIPSKWRFQLFGIPSGRVEESRLDSSRQENAAVLPDGLAIYHATCLDAQNRLAVNLRDCHDSGYAERLILKQRFFPKVSRTSESILNLASYGDQNYFHWILETLPRLRYAEKLTEPWSSIYVCQCYPYQRQSLPFFGIAPGQVIDSSKTRFLRARRLILPRYCLYQEHWIYSWLREKVLPQIPASQTPRRIYISRRRSPGRGIANEAEVEVLLKELGFACVVLEDLAWPEQIALFRSAEMVVAPHGAGLTNSLFCPKDAQIIECRLNTLNLFCYEHITTPVGIRHSTLPCEAADSRKGSEAQIRVDLQQLRRLVRERL
jgi:hypothetical protein